MQQSAQPSGPHATMCGEGCPHALGLVNSERSAGGSGSLQDTNVIFWIRRNACAYNIIVCNVHFTLNEHLYLRTLLLSVLRIWRHLNLLLKKVDHKTSLNTQWISLV